MSHLLSRGSLLGGLNLHNTQQLLLTNNLASKPNMDVLLKTENLMCFFGSQHHVSFKQNTQVCSQPQSRGEVGPTETCGKSRFALEAGNQGLPPRR
jgi:hypothetical protein